LGYDDILITMFPFFRSLGYISHEILGTLCFVGSRGWSPFFRGSAMSSDNDEEFLRYRITSERSARALIVPPDAVSPPPAPVTSEISHHSSRVRVKALVDDEYLSRR